MTNLICEKGIYNETSEYHEINLSEGNDRNRVRWIGDFYHGGKTGCRIQIKTVTLRDNGDWSCEITYWPHDSQGKNQLMLHSQIDYFARNLMNSKNG